MNTKIEIQLNQKQVAIIEHILERMPEENRPTIEETCEALLAREIATIDYVERHDAAWMTTDSIRAALMNAESEEEIEAANDALFTWAASQHDENSETLDQ